MTDNALHLQVILSFNHTRRHKHAHTQTHMQMTKHTLKSSNDHTSVWLTPSYTICLELYIDDQCTYQILVSLFQRDKLQRDFRVVNSVALQPWSLLSAQEKDWWEWLNDASALRDVAAFAPLIVGSFWNLVSMHQAALQKMRLLFPREITTEKNRRSV